MAMQQQKGVARPGDPSPSVLRIVAPILAALFVTWLVAVISLELLSTIRAYVAGEGLYSKGQKNAAFYLSQYATSHTEDDLEQYWQAIAIPEGARKARVALLASTADEDAARLGFLELGIHPSDVGGMIRLFRWFHGVEPMKTAISIWTEGDDYTQRISMLAGRLQQLPSGGGRGDERAQILVDLGEINQRLTPLELRFSATLGETARLGRSAVIVSITLASLLTALLCVRVTRARMRERDSYEGGMARITQLYAALSHTSQLIVRVVDQDELFDELCGICVEFGGLKLAAVARFEADTEPVQFIAARDAGAAGVPALTLVAQHGESQEFRSLTPALRTGSSQIRNRLRGSATLSLRPGTSQIGPFGSAAYFPLRQENEVVGALCVFSEEEEYFRADIVALIEQLANEVSFALEMIHRERDRRYQARHLADQNLILNLIASGAELKGVLTTISKFAESYSSGAICAMVTLDATGNHYALGIAPSLPEDYQAAVMHRPLEEAAGPCAEAMRSASPVVIDDLDAYPLDIPLRDFLRTVQVHSVRAWPIFGNKGGVLGALALYSRGPASSALIGAELAGICTDLAAIAIESRTAAERIRHLAHHDELTGLPNRLLFNHELARALVRAKRGGGSLGVLYLDLDRFKVINDSLGHDAGDEVLRQVSERVLGALRKADRFARVGGDEFTLLIEHFESPQVLADIAQKILGVAAQTMNVNGHECQLSGSIGIAIYPEDAQDGASLLKNADIAMYRAKTSGRNNYQFYSHEMNEHSVERLALETQLRHAIAHREFEVFYQPKVNIATGRVAGAEALVRWRHPERGLLFPGDFIGIAEEVGLIGSIGRLVLEGACRDARSWFDGGITPIRIAINLSAQQFEDTRLLDDLDRILEETGYDPGALEFEITESVVMTSPEKALVILDKIKKRGITLAIDDFGTGHSSLAYLKRFPVDTVKIDRAFVRDLSVDPNDLAITQAIIAMGHSMGLKVVAEGVETAVQLEILRRHRCDEFQGFLFSKAIPAAEFEQLMKVDGQVLGLRKVEPAVASG